MMVELWGVVVVERIYEIVLVASGREVMQSKNLNYVKQRVIKIGKYLVTHEIKESHKLIVDDERKEVRHMIKVDWLSLSGSGVTLDARNIDVL
ncbi:unnamed protein product [Brugia timori]|uniref:BRCT domain-containing protein n=1 Tax=Brugia timori TaxID=42155 RepID=A0A0R3QPI6_9BILA|nr:unnamed protein product [Brugia timori]